MIDFENNNLDRIISGLFDVIRQGKEPAIDFYNDWVSEVKRTVPPERLLIFNVKEGWNPLCKFLDLPVPNQPFPNTNDSKMIKKGFMIQKIIAYTVVFGMPIAMGTLGYVFRANIFSAIQLVKNSVFKFL